MDEKELREDAIKRFENGESPKEIYQSLKKSKAWFFKWLRRHKHERENWACSRSRRPHHTSRRIDSTLEQAVIETRKKRERQLYAQIGALSINYDLQQQGVNPLPLSTINKILKRNELVRKRPKYTPKGVDYPSLPVEQSNCVHQFDVVGPRYLKTDGRFYSANFNMDIAEKRLPQDGQIKMSLKAEEGDIIISSTSRIIVRNIHFLMEKLI